MRRITSEGLARWRLIGGILLVASSVIGEMGAQVERSPIHLSSLAAQPESSLLRPARLFAENLPLSTALLQLRQRSGVDLAYSSRLIPAALRVSCNCATVTVGEALDRLLAGTRLDYSELNGQIIIEAQPAANRLMQETLNARLLLSETRADTADADDFVVRGRVTSEATGAGLEGVVVLHVGSQTRTTTDASGNYSIRIAEASGTLRFLRIGYSPREATVSGADGGTTTLDVALQEAVVNLEEMVVTGLASNVKRANLANAVSTLSAKDLTGTTRQETIDGALSGKIPGVNIRALGGAPGGGVNMQFRGISTLGAGASQPLFIIDGVYADNSSIGTGRTALSVGSGTGTNTRNDNVSNRMADLNPEDVESIEVLKGPSAAAIYGARANAGVVIIRTKRGSAGRLNFSLSQDVGVSSALRFLGYDNWSEEKIDLLFTDPARNALEKQRFRQGHTIDWERELYGERGFLTNTQLSMSGGTEQTRFFVSGGLQDEDGIIKHTGFGRKSLRVNIDQQLLPNITISSNSNYVRYDSDRGFTDNGSGSSIGYNLANTPNYYDLRPVDGVYPDNPYYRENPYSVRDNALNHNVVNRYVQGISLDATLLQRSNSTLRLTAQGGLDFLNSQTLLYFPEILQNQRAQANPGDVVRGTQENLNMNGQAFLSFNTTRRSTMLTSQLGITGQGLRLKNLFVRGRGLAPNQTNINQAQVQQIFTQFDQRVNDIGVAAQQEVNFNDKLIATAGIRLDKSTLNATADKFYAFPKGSVALNLANFGFWPSRAIEQFKLRAAYGETGGLPVFGQTFEVLSGTAIGGNLGSTVSTRGVDPNLRPESASELELGFDVSMWRGALGLEVTYYRKQVRDLILDLVPAASTGITAIATNAADLQNNGIEAVLRISPIRKPQFNWASQLTFWNNRTKITRLDVPSFATGGFGSSLGDYLIKEGMSPTTIVGTPATPELTVYGDGQPDYNLSWSNEFRFLRNFELSGLMHYQHGGKIINLTQFLMDGAGTTPDWSRDDDGNGIPNGRDRGPAVAGRYIDDGTYFKLREVGFYYTLPSQWAAKLKSKRARVAVTGRNLILISDYRSYDPEVSVNGVQAIASTVEIAAYPSARRIMFHLNLDF